MARLCKALDFTRSGINAWLSRAPSHRARSDAEILANVFASFNESARTYGARRVWRDLIAAGVFCGLHKIERLMRANALRDRPRRRGLPKGSGDRAPVVASNVLNRQFMAASHNQSGSLILPISGRSRAGSMSRLSLISSLAAWLAGR